MDAKVAGDDKSNEGSQSALSPDDAVPLDQGMREIAQMLAYGDLYAAHESENERFDWISRDPLMRDIVHMIATGNWKGLRKITDVVGNYETNYEKQSAGQTTATVWTIAACDSLYEEGLYRNQVTKAEIQAAGGTGRVSENRPRAGAHGPDADCDRCRVLAPMTRQFSAHAVCRTARSSRNARPLGKKPKIGGCNSRVTGLDYS
jgi:hypothetical protein